MLYLLDKNDYPKIRPLFADLAGWMITVKSALAGERPAQIYVDDLDHPQSALLSALGRDFLAGNPTNSAFNQALKTFLTSPDFIHDPCRNSPEMSTLYYHPAEWRKQFSTVSGTLFPVEVHRRHYVFRQFPFDWKTHLPAGFVARPIDQALLENDQLKNIQGMRNWTRNYWPGDAINTFYQQGGSICLQRGDEIVSWCLVVEIAGQSCELGIETVSAYRRQGFGALAAMAAVAACLERGFTTIDWYCHETNRGSWGVAEKSGFVLGRKYTYFLCYFDQTAYYAGIGETLFDQQNYAAAVEWFAKAIANGNAKNWMYHIIAETYAALGDADSAIRHLNAAIDKGWNDIDFTRHCANFTVLQDLPEWAALLTRMQAKS